MRDFPGGSWIAASPKSDSPVSASPPRWVCLPAQPVINYFSVTAVKCQEFLTPTPIFDNLVFFWNKTSTKVYVKTPIFQFFLSSSAEGGSFPPSGSDTSTGQGGPISSLFPMSVQSSPVLPGRLKQRPITDDLTHALPSAPAQTEAAVQCGANGLRDPTGAASLCPGLPGLPHWAWPALSAARSWPWHSFSPAACHTPHCYC